MRKEGHGTTEAQKKVEQTQKQKHRRKWRRGGSGEEMAEHEEEMKEKKEKEEEDEEEEEEEEEDEEEEEEAVDGFSGCRRRRRRARTKENINNRVQMRQWRERGRGGGGPSGNHTRRLCALAAGRLAHTRVVLTYGHRDTHASIPFARASNAPNDEQQLRFVREVCSRDLLFATTRIHEDAMPLRSRQRNKGKNHQRGKEAKREENFRERDSVQPALNSGGDVRRAASKRERARDPFFDERVSIKSIISSRPGAKASLSITYGFILRSFCGGSVHAAESGHAAGEYSGIFSPPLSVSLSFSIFDLETRE